MIVVDFHYQSEYQCEDGERWQPLPKCPVPVATLSIEVEANGKSYYDVSKNDKRFPERYCNFSRNFPYSGFKQNSPQW